MRASNGSSALDARVTRTNAAAANSNGLSNGDEADFESLVSGRKTGANGNNGNDLMNDWGTATSTNRTQTQPQQQQSQPTFSWQSAAPAPNTATLQPQRQQAQTVSRAITPDTTLSSFASLTPSSPWSQPLQPTSHTPSSISSTSTVPLRPSNGTSLSSASGGIDWSAASSNNVWSSQRSTQQQQQQQQQSGARSFGLPPPPKSPQAFGEQGIGGGFPGMSGRPVQPMQQQQPKKGGLDQYESLL